MTYSVDKETVLVKHSYLCVISSLPLTLLLYLHDLLVSERRPSMSHLWVCPQEEYLTSCYWRTSPQPVDTMDKCDTSRPYYELYKVDFEQFRTLFLALVPQATGPRAPTLALRAFRVSPQGDSSGR